MFVITAVKTSFDKVTEDVNEVKNSFNKVSEDIILVDNKADCILEKLVKENKSIEENFCKLKD